MMWGFWLSVFVLGSITLFWLLAPVHKLEAPAMLKGRVSYVVDGDSLYLREIKIQIRLWGVDAPEVSESGFQAASDYLFLIAHGQSVTCRIMTRDRYGRHVARCFLPDGRELNRLMIESGRAKEYRRFTKGFYSRFRRD